MDIGDRIKAARLAAGYSTQRAFAERLGVTHGIVGAWENHTKKPGRDLLLKIAELTGVDAEELANGPPPGQKPTDPIRVALDRRIDRLSRRAQKNLLELLDVTADVGGVLKKEGHPLKTE
jgi:transcriptional regulator with XRE-family HTH domain